MLYFNTPHTSLFISTSKKRSNLEHCCVGAAVCLKEEDVLFLLMSCLFILNFLVKQIKSSDLCDEGQRNNLPSVAIRPIVNNIHTDANHVLWEEIWHGCEKEKPGRPFAPLALTQSHQVKLNDVHIQAGHVKKQI